MESLLSTSPLMVAAAPDMDLLSCIDYFLDRCTVDEGKIAKRFAQMPVGNLLRGGWKQHVLTTADIPQLRRKAKKCLQVRGMGLSVSACTMESLRLTYPHTRTHIHIHSPSS